VNRKTFNIIGWILLLVMGASWIGFGYSSWSLLLTPMAYISFAINDGSIKKLGKIKQMSLLQVLLILFAFIVSVNDIFHITGGIKTISEIIAVVLSLYPVKFTFGTVIFKVMNATREKNYEF
jgi:hypothetical protein